MGVPWLAETVPSIAAEKTTRPRSCKRAKASLQAGLSGAQLAPVIATKRPPGARRARAEAIWRSAASFIIRSTWATAENGGFIRATMGTRDRTRTRLNYHPL